MVRSSPLGADMVGKSRNMSADMLIMPGLLALMPPTICCVRSQSVRDLVTEISGGATPHRCGVAQSSSSELATQAWPSQPHSRLVVPVHVGSRLAHSGSPTHPSLQRLSTVPCVPELVQYFANTLVKWTCDYIFKYLFRLWYGVPFFCCLFTPWFWTAQGLCPFIVNRGEAVSSASTRVHSRGHAASRSPRLTLARDGISFYIVD